MRGGSHLDNRTFVRYYEVVELGQGWFGELGGALDQLRTANLELESLSGLAEGLVELRSRIDGLEAEWQRRVAVFDQRQGRHLDGYPSTTAFLKHRCRMSSSRAHRAVVQSRRLEVIPAVIKLFQAGELSFDQMQVMASVPVRLDSDLEGAQAELGEAVRDLTVTQTRMVVDYWIDAIDGPGADSDRDDLHDQRYLHCSKTWQGMVKIDGLFDPVEGDLLLAALQTITPPPSEGDQRSAGQRRADALSDLARLVLLSDQAPGGQRPHLMVLTDTDALRGHRGGTHQTLNGTIWGPEQIRQLACDCNLTRLVYGADSQPIDLGRTTRTVPAHLARAVYARDQHCQGPGCDRPAQWCQIHHIRHWADGGPTNLDNLTLYCQHHHTLAHREGDRDQPTSTNYEVEPRKRATQGSGFHSLPKVRFQARSSP